MYIALALRVPRNLDRIPVHEKSGVEAICIYIYTHTHTFIYL